MNFKSFEVATVSLSDPGKRVEAESYLAALRSEQDVYLFYLQVLEMQNVPIQQFHAASGLGIWTMNHYSIDTKPLLKDIRLSLIKLIRDDMVHYVREEIAQVIALISKRSWMDDSEQERLQFLGLIWNLIEQNSNLKFNALIIISALLNEFNSDKASAVGLPREFHLYTRKIFQERLLEIFTRVLALLHSVIQGYSDSQKSLLKLCFMIVEKIISWDFLDGKSNIRDRKSVV